MTTTHTPDEAVAILVHEGYDREDAAVLVGQVVDISGDILTDEDLDLVREQIAATADDVAALA